ncbi:MAG TPA: hypothetical protein DCQ26_16040 [Marinilabiliales bacterium]|nr:MAG: hypothetical protein A2W84_05275 [Bacteroidetes bacterium GWC2_40_13]OFX75448.1 MAG: hypothetical protein A2W96_08295 [Bacteroidetes bacterium GWD2_40_43]OFX93963.1 MAG: hypothetical protein A2W97_14220 [Bacteroidetes bacterium GWE2_40_63]OFY19752.1 MAG: hypothetical protein A2W88_03090 [Bacteroidetes bacterium GWF2_40_13]HAN00110.1 hypothetical protein [Marinilabiliales bacterium]
MEPWVYNILAYAIVGMALFAAAKKVYTKFSQKQKSSSCAGGCGGCTSKCELKSLVDVKKINP